MPRIDPRQYSARESCGCYRRGSIARTGAHPILVMQVHLPGIDYGCMDTASVPPASASVSMATPVPRCCRRSRRWSRSSRARVTVLAGLLDRSALPGVLAEIETLGLDFIEVRQLTPERESPQPGGNPVTAEQPNFRSNQAPATRGNDAPSREHGTPRSR